MKGFLFYIFFLALSTTTSFAQQQLNDAQWKKSVEEILSTLSLGPLRAEFSPKTLATRTRQDVLIMQTMSLRAHLIKQMTHTLSSTVKVCPLPESSEEAIQHVLLEMKNRTFDIHWIKSDGECMPWHGFVFVSIPPPATDVPVETNKKEL